MDDPEAIIDTLLAAQRDIAAGKGKGITAAQQTAASREVRDLIEHKRALQAGKPQAGVEWEDVSAVRREACSLVLTGIEAFSLRVLDLDITVAGERNDLENLRNRSLVGPCSASNTPRRSRLHGLSAIPIVTVATTSSETAAM